MPLNANFGRAVAKEIKRYGKENAVARLETALTEGHLDARDFSIRDLATELVGSEYVAALGRRSDPLTESGAVDSTMFLTITTSLISSRVMAGFNKPEYLASRLVDTMSSQMYTEMIPGVEDKGDQAQTVAEGMPFQEMTYAEDYVETPRTTKRGRILSITKEAIFFDRTGLVLRNAEGLGEMLGLNKEKRIMDVLCGNTNTYKRKGTTYNTYQSSSPWVNTASGKELLDKTDIDEALQLFYEMTDFNSGERIAVTPRDILVAPAKQMTAASILFATQIEAHTGSGALTTISQNPVGSQYNLYSSIYWYDRLVAGGKSTTNAKNYWLFGDIRKAFAYVENWPIQVLREPANATASFERDVVSRWRVDERGVAAVMEPQAVALLYQA